MIAGHLAGKRVWLLLPATENERRDGEHYDCQTHASDFGACGCFHDGFL
jgi:hypothetical protein